jgi:hypothetical protein
MARRPRNGPITIYALVDPRTATALYIGQTRHPAERLSSHANPRMSEQDRRAAWARELAAEDLRPLMVTLERVPEAEATEVEAFWICSLRAAGSQLFNRTDGDRTMTPETRARQRAARMGTEPTAETRAKIKARAIGRRQSPETVEKRRRKLIGRTFRQSTLSKMEAAVATRKEPTAETRGKLAAKARAQWEPC